MLKSIRSKIVVPVIGVVLAVLTIIIVFVYLSMLNLTNTLSTERAQALSSAAKLHLDELKAYNALSVVMIAQNNMFAELIQKGDRDQLLSYMEQRRAEINAFNIVITDTRGAVIGRTNAPDFFGDDLGGSPGIKAALRGETLSAFSTGPLVPMAISTFLPLHYGDVLVGVLIVNINMSSNEFVDKFSEYFYAEITVFGVNKSVATTLRDEKNERAIGIEAPQHVTDTVLVQKKEKFTEHDVYGNPYYSFYYPLFDVTMEPAGMFLIEFSNLSAIKLSEKERIKIIIISAIGLLALAVVTFFIIEKIAKPINLLTSVLKDTANGDLTKRLPEKGKDEIAAASHSFNTTMHELWKMITGIKAQAEKISHTGDTLSKNMTETASAINEITANIQSIKNGVLNQSASVTETNAAMEQVVHNINNLDILVQKQSENVTQASTAIEEMSANIQSVTGTLANNEVNVKVLQEASEVGRSGLQDVAEDIQEIARESEGLLEINSVMENIASQTNLLSMNAAIEAAHAGEAGKGFAVVADEIRKLAENSSEQSKTISEVLKKIKSSIEKIIGSTKNVLTKFEAIDSSVKVVSQQEQHIHHAMEEQGVGSRQIVTGVMEVNEITRQVKNSSGEMLIGSKEVIDESNNLKKATQEITTGMNEMASGAEQINVAVNQVNEISNKNREDIALLLKEVLRFKVE